MGLKSEDEILHNSMTEDDPNSNIQFNKAAKQTRWGPRHAGAKELASQYTAGRSAVKCQNLLGNLQIIHVVVKGRQVRDCLQYR